MTDTLKIIEQRQQEAKRVKESGVIDRIQGNDKQRDDELAEIDNFSFNVAWNFEGENKRQAEEKMSNLKEDTGYTIDYSNMK